MDTGQPDSDKHAADSEQKNREDTFRKFRNSGRTLGRRLFRHIHDPKFLLEILVFLSLVLYTCETRRTNNLTEALLAESRNNNASTSGQTSQLISETHTMATNAGTQAKNAGDQVEQLKRMVDASKRQADAVTVGANAAKLAAEISRKAAVDTHDLAIEAKSQADAAKELSSAASASAEATKVMSETTARQFESAERPWLRVEMQTFGDLVVAEDSVSMTVPFRILNVGRSPARNVFIKGEIFLRIQGHANAIPEAKRLCENVSTLDISPASGDTVFPGDPYAVNQTFTTNTGDVQQYSSDGMVHPVLLLCVGYRPPFSEASYYTGLGYSIQGRNLGFTPGTYPPTQLSFLPLVLGIGSTMIK